MKKNLILTILVVMGLLFISCKPATPTAKAEPSKEPEKVTITVWHGDAESVSKITQDLITSEFNKLYPYIEVKYELAPEPFKDKLLVAIPMGTGPDLFEWNHDWLGTVEKAGLVQPIDDLITSNIQNKFVESAFEAGKYKGKTYTLPISAEAGALAYNKALLGSQVLPVDSDQLVTMMSSFKDQGYIGISYPFAPFLVSGYIHAFGGYLWDDVKGLGVNSAETKKAMQWVLDTFKPYMTSDPSWDPQVAIFPEGKSPFAINGPWSVGAWTDAKIDFGVMPLPKISSIGKMPQPYIGLKSIYMTKNAKNRDAAFKFMVWATTSKERILQRATKLGYIPVLKEVMDLPEVKNNPIINGFASQVALGKPMASGPEMVAVWGPFQDALNLMFSGEKTVDKACDDAQAAIEKAISEMK